MGTILSTTTYESQGVIQQQELPPEAGPTDDETETRKRQHEEDMRKFKEELAVKREARKEAIASLNRRIEELKEELEREREEKQRLENLLEDKTDGKPEIAGLEKQVKALKDVASIGGEMLRIRELQVNELKSKLKAIEATGIQYEKEVDNMRKLKALYEERSHAMAIRHQREIDRERTKVVAAETRLEISEEKNRDLLEKNKELQERITLLDSTVDKNNSEISDLRIQLAGKTEDLYNVTQQMTIINNLFSQVLSDPENLDRVTRVLEEHHNLVNHLTVKGEINDVASVLMTVADKDHILTEEENDIATNLGKVWKLLVELLGHHNKQITEEPMPESCYKSVDTPSGPKLVISVSQTFLRLKDLILEKNTLVKEVGRLKDLNTHLEKRLVSQESRLAEVADELHKTWDVVHKLKSQHKALHTHEQILRYELKHKRLMLNELKEQLEECREMWQMARSKNNQTEKDWRLLRKEFADRKQQISSAESGYEESPGDSQDEDDSHRLSDDESEVHESPLVGNQVLRISRLEHLQLSSPERSNTPDSSEADFPISEESNSAIENNEEPTDCLTSETIVDALSSNVAQFRNTPSPSVNMLRLETPSSHSYSEDYISQPNNNTYSNLSSIPEEIPLELNPTIQILPWNESNSDEPQPVINELTTTTDSNCIQDNVSTQSDRQSSSKNLQELESCASVFDAECKSVTPDDTPHMSSSTHNMSAEERLARRDARLKRLEEQCKNLFCKVSDTNKRSDLIKSKLVELHEHYGEGKSETICSPETSMFESSNTIRIPEEEGIQNKISKTDLEPSSEQAGGSGTLRTSEDQIHPDIPEGNQE